MFLAQVACLGAVALAIALVAHKRLTPRYERAISKVLDFDQK